MKYLSLLGVALGSAVAISACGDDFEPASGSSGSAGAGATDGGGGSSGIDGGGSSGIGGGGGSAGAGPCEPGTTEACYSGPSGTADVGICKQGTRTCASDGSFGPCTGEVVPAAEDCTQPQDEDCNGVACSELAWAKLVGDDSEQSVIAVATDANDSIYVAGSFKGTIDFGGKPLTATGTTNSDVFIVKLDPAGTVLWAEKYGTLLLWDIAVDSAGNVIVVGAYEDIGKFGTVDLPTPAQNYVAKVSPTGAVLWAKSVPRKTGFYPRVAVGPSDRIVVAHATAAGTGGTSTVISVSAFDTSGAPAGSASLPVAAVSAWAFPNDIAIASDGNIFLAAQFQNDLSLGTQTLTSNGKLDAAFIKLAQNLSPLWALQFGGPDDDMATAVAVDKTTGNVFMLGEFQGIAKFAGADMTSVSSSDGYVVAASTGGSVTWRKQFGGLSSPWPQAIVTDGQGNVALSGTAQSGVNFGGGEVSGAFLAKLTSAGDHVWSKGFGTNAYGWTLATDSKDNLILGGTSADPIDFGDGVLTPNGPTDAFVAKLAP